MFIQTGGRRGRARMVVGYTTTYAICAYHLQCNRFESRIVALSVLDSNIFSIVLRVCNLTDFMKSHVSSVRLDITYGTPPRLIKGNTSPCCVLKYVNKHSFLLPQIYGLFLIPKAKPTSPFSLKKSRLPMQTKGELK